MNLPHVKPEVLMRQEPGDLLINMATGKIYRVNQTVLTMLEACLEGTTEQDLAERLTGPEDDRATVELDIKKTLERFSEPCGVI